MPLSNETWKAVVRRKFKMSTQFRNLDAAVVQYLNLTPAPQKEDARQTLKVRWDAWEKKLEQNGKTYKSSDRYFQNCALDDVASLVAGAGVKAELNVKLSPSRQNAVIQQRDALTPNLRSGGTHHVKNNAGTWEPVIFPQEQTYSCTCACATTFLNKLIGQPVTEAAFKDRYNKITGSAHDFGLAGTVWPPIRETLAYFGADVTFQTTSNWDALKSILQQATRDVPVLFGVRWDGGGGHAVMCLGHGPIPGWGLGQVGFLIHDPWPEDKHPGLRDDGDYFVYVNNNWSKATAQSKWGCITGKKTPTVSQFAKPASYKQVGRKVM